MLYKLNAKTFITIYFTCYHIHHKQTLLLQKCTLYERYVEYKISEKNKSTCHNRKPFYSKCEYDMTNSKENCTLIKIFITDLVSDKINAGTLEVPYLITPSSHGQCNQM